MRSAVVFLFPLALMACSSLSRPLSGSRFLQKSASALSEPVRFGFDQWDLRTDDRNSLAQKATVLKRLPKVRLTLEGHTDRIGAAAYNLWLGDRRARTVQVALVGLGVDPRRLIVVSHGEKRPRVMGNGPSDLAQNRRVEFVIR